MTRWQRFKQWWGDLREPSGAYRSLDFNRRHGRWRVLYPDGERTQIMCRDVAENYRSLYGGTIIRRDQ